MPKAPEAKPADLPTDGTPETGVLHTEALTAAAQAAGFDADPGETILTYPHWGPPPVDENVAISFHQIQLSEFHGEDPEPVSQGHLERFEDFLRSHAVGGSNRNSEGFYGPKTRELVDAAYQNYLGKPARDGRVDEDLWEALREAGAVVTG
jgi:peptidoglycan hydrolase-like protein with peptidoglycan-binding domain